ncbi:MAG: hypothetical protein WC919_00855 [Candidatus Paceibacterota bacterium]|jgi:hypothetical protein
METKQIKLTSKLTKLKDGVGNTLGMVKLNEQGEIVLYPARPVRMWDGPPVNYEKPK